MHILQLQSPPHLGHFQCSSLGTSSTLSPYLRKPKEIIPTWWFTGSTLKSDAHLPTREDNPTCYSSTCGKHELCTTRSWSCSYICLMHLLETETFAIITENSSSSGEKTSVARQKQVTKETHFSNKMPKKKKRTMYIFFSFTFKRHLRSILSLNTYSRNLCGWTDFLC